MPVRPTDLADPVVTFVTSLGTIEVQLLPSQAPITVANFLRYTDVGFYDGVVFHRLPRSTDAGPAVVAQAGLLAAGEGRSYSVRSPLADPIVLESQNGLSNTLGTLAMARTPVPDSASAQFYFNTADNSADFDYIDAQKPGYAVFGNTLKGLDVLATISQAETFTANASALGLGILADFPQQNIVIETARSTRFFSGKRADYRIDATATDTLVTHRKSGAATSVADVDRLQFKDLSLGINEIMTGALATTAVVGIADADGLSFLAPSTRDELFSAGFANVTLDGGLGNDTLIAGAGNDHFAFTTALGARTNLDTVQGFDPAQDRLLLSRDIFTAYASAGLAEGALPAASLVQGAKPVARAPDHHLLYNTRTGDLAYDPDGSGKQKPTVFVKLVGVPALTATSLMFIDPAN